jgi:DNA primase
MEQIITVFDYYDRHLNPDRREQNIRCLLHDDTRPSMRVNINKGVWHCPVCNKGGGVVTLVQEVESISYAEAVAKIRQIGGGEVKSASPSAHKRSRGTTRWIPPRLRAS